MGVWVYNIGIDFRHYLCFLILNENVLIMYTYFCFLFVGMFSNAGETVCTRCPPGYACANASAAAKTLCSAGEYATGNAIKCTICPSGHYCPSIRFATCYFICN